MTDPRSAEGVEEPNPQPDPLPDPDGETSREGGADTEGLEGLRDLT